MRTLLRFLPWALWLVCVDASAATFWTGPEVSFSKTPFADPALAANQDRLTANVWITRASSRGLYNAAQETSYGVLPPVLSPLGTQWALGSLAGGVQGLTFAPWETTVRSIAPGAGPPNAVGVPMVMHLVADDIYLDINVTNWNPLTSGGGGFSYLRSSPPPAVTVSQKVPMLPWPALLAMACGLAAVGITPPSRRGVM